MSSVRPILGVPLTIASSLLIFSGSLQFAIVALLAAGAAAPALLLTACTLNLRHLVMGAVLRPRIGGSRLRRAAHAFFLPSFPRPGGGSAPSSDGCLRPSLRASRR